MGTLLTDGLLIWIAAAASLAGLLIGWARARVDEPLPRSALFVVYMAAVVALVAALWREIPISRVTQRPSGWETPDWREAKPGHQMLFRIIAGSIGGGCFLVMGVPVVLMRRRSLNRRGVPLEPPEPADGGED